MKKFSIFLFIALIAMINMASALSNFGPTAGFNSKGVINAEKGFTGNYDTDVGTYRATYAPVVWVSLGSPAAANTTQLYNDLPCSSTASKTAAQLTAAGYDPTPDVARGISITPNASFTGDVYFNGTDINDITIAEKVSWSSSSSTKSTTKAFKTVTSMNLTTDAAKTFDIGYNDLLGLPETLATNMVLGASLAGTKESTAPTVTVSATVLSTNTVDLNSALAGTAVKVWYVRT